MSLVVKNGKVFVDGELRDADVLVENDKIVDVAKDLDGDVLVDAKDKVVLPGVIDPHVHCRDFEQAYKEDFLSASVII